MPAPTELPAIPPLDHPRRATHTELTKLGRLLKRHYNAGKTITELAAELDCSYGFTRRLLLEANTRIRTTTGSGRAK